MAESDQPSDFAAAMLAHADLGLVGELFTVRLRRVDYLLSRATAKAWKGQRLRTGTIGVLSLIDRTPGISQNEIAKRLTVDKSAVNAIINQLEKLGWAQRRQSADDARRHALHLTSEGRAALQRIIGEIAQIEARMLAGMDPAVIGELTRLLDVLYGACLGAEAKGGSGARRG